MSDDNKDVNDIKNDDVVVTPPVKQKNPKRVAAGKKLAENNKLQKEHYNKLILEKTEKERDPPKIDDYHDVKGNSGSNTIYYVLGVCVLGTVGYYCYNNCHKEVKPIIEKTIVSQKVKKPVSKSQKIEW